MMREFNQSRRDSMRKMLIASGACLVMAHVGTQSVNSENMAKYYSGKKSLVDDKVLNQLSQPEKTVYIVIKENSIYSKKVKEDDILSFTRSFVSEVNDEKMFEGAFGNFQSQMQLMSLFIKYIHA
ncbi:hypothetical protein [Grimontia celer]|nr:hypothetical protein [Grimontia celer]